MPEPLNPERLAAASRQLSEETAEKLLAAMQRAREVRPIAHIRNSQMASALLGTVGLALFIVGVENAAADIPVLSNAYGSTLVGLAILTVTGVMLRMLSGRASLPGKTAGER